MECHFPIIWEHGRIRGPKTLNRFIGEWNNFSDRFPGNPVTSAEDLYYHKCSQVVQKIFTRVPPAALPHLFCPIPPRFPPPKKGLTVSRKSLRFSL